MSQLGPCDLEAADRPDPSAPGKEVGLNDPALRVENEVVHREPFAISPGAGFNANRAKVVIALSLADRQAAGVPDERRRVNLPLTQAPSDRSADDHLSGPPCPSCGDLVARPDVDAAQQIVVALGQQSHQPLVQPLHPRRTRALDLPGAGDRHAFAAMMPDQRLGLDPCEAEERDDARVEAEHIREFGPERLTTPPTTPASSIGARRQRPQC